MQARQLLPPADRGASDPERDAGDDQRQAADLRGVNGSSRNHAPIARVKNGVT
ncbi:MAG TPA: hypothetical protein VGJ77_14140 [Gaiellaceae bacterium]